MEFSQILGVPILDRVPFTNLEATQKPEVVAATLHLKRANIVSSWGTKSGVEGLSTKFLLEKAQKFLDAISYYAFKEIVALLIYNLVLFPNPDGFIDVHAIKIFLTHNPVPTLLGDILHSLHIRTIMHRGTLMICIPLLHGWFISHLPRSIRNNEQRCPWSQRIMSLSHADIIWCPRSLEDLVIIDHCSEFPNVPLLGIRGSITYNPSLALLQFNYARRVGLHDMIIQGIAFNYVSDSQDYRQRFIRAWNKVYRVNSQTWGQKNSLAMEPYLRWVRTRA